MKDQKENSDYRSHVDRRSHSSNVQYGKQWARSILQIPSILVELLTYPLLVACFALSGMGALAFMFLTPMMAGLLYAPWIFAKFLIYISPVIYIVIREAKRREKIKDLPEGWISALEKELAKTKQI